MPLGLHLKRTKAYCRPWEELKCRNLFNFIDVPSTCLTRAHPSSIGGTPALRGAAGTHSEGCALCAWVVSALWVRAWAAFQCKAHSFFSSPASPYFHIAYVQFSCCFLSGSLFALSGGQRLVERSSDSEEVRLLSRAVLEFQSRLWLHLILS